MTPDTPDFWTDDTSVILTSFWGWSPETWGTIGWTGDQGLSRRTNLLQELSDPFIAVIYVTNKAEDEGLRGKIVGFYLVSHETGHRDEFSHPNHHAMSPGKWDHSLRAVRAFSYVPEYRLNAAGFDPGLTGPGSRALAVSKWAEVLKEQSQIGLLRETPWAEVEVYVPKGQSVDTGEEDFSPSRGFNRAGPANRNGYVVSSSALELARQLYIFRFEGCTDSYLGKPSGGQRIYKIGLSASPELRKQSLQNALPKGAYRWTIHRSDGNSGHSNGFSFKAAVEGEYAMKKYLAKNGDWLAGEFYLASDHHIESAWHLGCAVARSFNNS